MKSSNASGYLALAILMASGGVVLAAPTNSAADAESLRPVPKASCGANDQTESVQGQTTLAERFVAGPARSYNCNLELAGRFEGDGAGADVEALDECAYFTTSQLESNPNQGVVVLDVSNAEHPQAVGKLTSHAMRGAHESLDVNPLRKLLLASAAPDTFDVYDASDCRRPVLLKSQSIPGLNSHNGRLSTDGKTYYGAKWPQNPRESVAFALDVSEPANLRTLATWTPSDPTWITHNAAVNPDGSRVYVTLKRMTADSEQPTNPNGLLIFDTQSIQSREPNARFKLIGQLFWNDSHGAEGLQFFTIKGRSYLVFSDNLGAIGAASPPPADACKSGKPGHGFARIIDLSDEAHPQTVSRLMLEASSPENCSKVMHDPTTYGGYGSIACSVDNLSDSRLLACGSFEAGLRVFDIRDPRKPREIAYYKPAARRTERRPGSLFAVSASAPRGSVAADHTADSVLVAPRFRNNARELWFTSADNGFQIVRFSTTFVAAHPELFEPR